MSHETYKLRGNEFESPLTGKKYPFTKDRDGKSKQTAYQALIKDNLEQVRANNARAVPILGRELTLREHISGDWLPDTRDLRTKIQQDSVHNRQPVVDDDRNLAREQLESGRFDGESKERQAMRKRLEKEADEFDQMLADKRARAAKMNEPATIDAILDAKTTLTLLSVRGDVPHEHVLAAKQRKEAIEATGDVESYWTATKQFEAERDARNSKLASELDAQAKQLREQSKAVRNDQPIEIKSTTDDSSLVEDSL